jgi:hypothetical protein
MLVSSGQCLISLGGIIYRYWHTCSTWSAWVVLFESEAVHAGEQRSVPGQLGLYSFSLRVIYYTDTHAVPGLFELYSLRVRQYMLVTRVRYLVCLGCTLWEWGSTCWWADRRPDGAGCTCSHDSSHCCTERSTDRYLSVELIKYTGSNSTAVKSIEEIAKVEVQH